MAPSTHQTTIRIKAVAHQAIEEYADTHGVSYSTAANLFLLRGLLADRRITEQQFYEALRRHRPPSTYRKITDRKESS